MLVVGATASVVATGVVVAGAFGGRWPSSGSTAYGAAPWQPSSGGLSARGLVRENAVRGSHAALDEEDLQLRARLPSGPSGLVILLLKGLSENAASFQRLYSQQSLAIPPEDRGDELPVLIEEFISLMGLALRIMGMLLAVILPLSIAVLCLLSLPMRLPAPPRVLVRILEVLDMALMPLDCLLCPILCLTARSMGMGREELLENDSSRFEGLNRAKRIFMGLLVLNVLASILMLVALTIFVASVRTSGFLNH